MGDARQFHHQQKNEQTGNEILSGVGALPPDRDLFVFHPEMIKGINADGGVTRDKDMIHHRRQALVKIILLIHEQDLHEQGDRH
jgi:hypothetical protein